LGVEAPGWQGAKTQEWLDIPSFHTVSRTGCTGGQNMTLFLNEPFVRGVSDRVCIGFHYKDFGMRYRSSTYDLYDFLVLPCQNYYLEVYII
jgi:hypothetical protein